ncbi:MAG: DegT/DnrJ/EryC1/StrS family aminotransferase [Clostridiales bacterium]|nr:DegT/DnrJ/EryC1/StrS family aminotransferase [Candidatus Crickella merdequi]
MQFRDLKKQYQVLKSDIDAAMVEVAGSSQYIGGPWVKALEQELAEYVGVKHCVSCANGTDALSLAVMAWGIGEGDAVFVPDFTFFSSGEIVSAVGATPVFVDVDENTYNICAESLEKAILKVKEEGKLTPKVVVAVDLFGLPADFTKVCEVAKKYGILVLEDGAQGFGGKIGEQVACSFGDIATTSFFPAKPLGCYGDGGAVFTNDDEVKALLESFKVHGKGAMKYDNVRIGMNSRLDTIQAAILQVKLKAFKDYEVADVNKAAAMYDKALAALAEAGKLKLPVVPEGFLSSWAQYTIQVAERETRDALQAELKAKGIPSMVYYPKPMHKQEAFAGCTQTDADFPVTMKLCDTVLSLPMHPYLTQEEVDEVAAALKAFLK